MKRRGFLKWCGLAPLAALVPAIPDAMPITAFTDHVFSQAPLYCGGITWIEEEHFSGMTEEDAQKILDSMPEPYKSLMFGRWAL